MARKTPAEKGDRVIAKSLSKPRGAFTSFELESHTGSVISPGLLAAVRDLPRERFKERLRVNLERRATMATSTVAVPETRAGAVPYLSVRNAAAALEFYKKAFGATETSRLMQPDGRIAHAEISIAGARVMLADEFPEVGFKSPQTLGGSTAHINLYVPDVDVMAKRAVEGGAEVMRPVEDQFYGARSGQFRDPFGFVWTISTETERLSNAEMQRRLDVMYGKPAYIRSGFRSVTPYVIVPGTAQLIEFMKAAFDGEERFRVARPGTDTIMHAEVKIGDSMIELADANPQFPPTPATLLLRVPDPDVVYASAVAAGATAFDEMRDNDYGSRGGTVLDDSGNRWHIFTPLPGDRIFTAFRSITPHLYAEKPVDLIEFLREAFGGEEVYRAELPDGSIPHAQVRLGDSIVALAAGRGRYTAAPATLHLYVPDADAAYERALRAGASSIQPPATQPYGERSGGVADPFGNRWFLATHLGEPAR
jgi:PhnB protein